MWQLYRLSQPMVLGDVSLNCSAPKEVKPIFEKVFPVLLPEFHSYISQFHSLIVYFISQTTLVVYLSVGVCERKILVGLCTNL